MRCVFELEKRLKGSKQKLLAAKRFLNSFDRNCSSIKCQLEFVLDGVLHCFALFAALFAQCRVRAIAIGEQHVLFVRVFCG